MALPTAIRERAKRQADRLARVPLLRSLIWCFEILQYIKNLNFKKLKIAENVPASVKERDHPYRFDLSVSFIC